jgi:type VI secretion system lysozyme-like protein
MTSSSPPSSFPSLLDRLIEPLPTEAPAPGGATPRPPEVDGVEAVVRDLNELLNTCRGGPLPATLPPRLQRVRRSLYYYGLPDFSASSPHSAKDAEALVALVRQTIETYEPRLTNLVLERVVDGGPGAAERRDATQQGRLRLRISARLQLAPLPDPVGTAVTFDSVIDLLSGRVSVSRTVPLNEGQP